MTRMNSTQTGSPGRRVGLSCLPKAAVQQNPALFCSGLKELSPQRADFSTGPSLSASQAISSPATGPAGLPAPCPALWLSHQGRHPVSSPLTFFTQASSPLLHEALLTTLASSHFSPRHSDHLLSCCYFLFSHQSAGVAANFLLNDSGQVIHILWVLVSSADKRGQY